MIEPITTCTGVAGAATGGILLVATALGYIQQQRIRNERNRKLTIQHQRISNLIQNEANLLKQEQELQKKFNNIIDKSSITELKLSLSNIKSLGNLSILNVDSFGGPGDEEEFIPNTRIPVDVQIKAKIESKKRAEEWKIKNEQERLKIKRKIKRNKGKHHNHTLAEVAFATKYAELIPIIGKGFKKVKCLEDLPLDISNTAAWFTLNSKFYSENRIKGSGEYSKENAFRHMLWQTLLTYEISEDIAKEVGEAHENYYELDKEIQYTQELYFDNTDTLDTWIDLNNNQLARDFSKTLEEGLTRNEIALKVLEYFYTNGLWVGTQDSYGWGFYHPENYKLSKVEYENIKENINKCDSNGLNSVDYKKIKECFPKKSEKEYRNESRRPLPLKI